ncbi:MAG: biosynthetic-type acetolactate synthase large subunit [Firmicutes bacterium]|nr:biosynthetic-type acetolactate synthase large subunit [Bacillota bacterium]
MDHHSTASTETAAAAVSAGARVTGAEALLEAIEREGVEIVFGYPGGAVLPIYDAFHKRKARSGLKHVLVRHEQSAAHAADGYARATGKTGVCLATSGPGATNLVTGIACAFMDSVPLVALTGQVAVCMLGSDAFQEADMTGITMPITKHSYLVKDAADIPRVVREAFHIASTGRPGPVLIDLPRDVCESSIEPRYPKAVRLPGYKPCYDAHSMQVQKAAATLNNAKRPIICAGGGVLSSGASGQLLELAEKATIPVVTTMIGIGSFPRNHPLSLGMLGMHGLPSANRAVMEADVLLALGCRFADRVTAKAREFAPNAQIIHVDVDPAEIGKNVRADIPIVGDISRVLAALIPHVKAAEADGAGRKSWVEGMRAIQPPEPSLPFKIVEALASVAPPEAVVTTDVGQHQMWVAQHYPFTKPRTFISSGGLGAMGYGLPAAVGAQLGLPGRTVIHVSGDGSFQMNMHELSTVVAHRLPIKMIVMNNDSLGMVRQLQHYYCGARYCQIDLEANPDFVKIADAYGIPGFKVGSQDEVEPALRKAFEVDGPALVDIKVPASINVVPMVPSGKTLNDMVT